MKTKEESIQQSLLGHKYEAVNMLLDRGLILGEHYKVDGIFLQGSQNYGTDHENSDVDSKMAITPTYRALLEGKSMKHELVLGNKEHVVVQPTSSLIEQFFKGNVNSLEILYTDYFICGKESYWSKLREKRDEIVSCSQLNIVNATMGMINQKYSALFKCTETTAPFFEKYGYDNKNLIHVYRLLEMMKGMSIGVKYDICLKIGVCPVFMKFMSSVRNGEITKEEASVLMDNLKKEAEILFKQLKENFNDEGYSLARTFLKENIIKDYIEWAVDEQ